MSFARYFTYSLLSGLLLSLAWPEIGGESYFIFIAFFPLLCLESELANKKPRFYSLQVFGYAYLAFLIFNTTTTWWIKLASPGGMIMAEILNSLFMAIVFFLYHLTKKAINAKVAHGALIIYWLGFEYLHINWELSWIWLTLGNVFANDIKWIQWYEYTGSLGGSFWILLMNVLIFRAHLLLRVGLETLRMQVIYYTAIILLFALPILYSNHLYLSYVEKIDPVEVVVVQPNIDPYTDKFKGMSEQDQIDRMIRLAESTCTENTDLIVGPETAFPLGYWEHNLEAAYGTKKVRALLEKFPRAKYVVGLSTIKLYARDAALTPTARSLADGSGNHYDYYNTAMQIEKDQALTLYRKSKLVLGVEKMPFTSSNGFLENLSIQLGGASGSLGTEKEPINFTSTSNTGTEISLAPAICYESIYGAYLTGFVERGANLLVIITNDGWWGNTAGYHQHLAYGRLRAIELRRSVARSANTGISTFINQRGDYLQKSTWWTEDALLGTLNLNSEVTFYVKHKDFIGRIASFFAILLFIWALVSYLRQGKRTTPS